MDLCLPNVLTQVCSCQYVQWSRTATSKHWNKQFKWSLPLVDLCFWSFITHLHKVINCLALHQFKEHFNILSSCLKLECVLLRKKKCECWKTDTVAWRNFDFSTLRLEKCLVEQKQVRWLTVSRGMSLPGSGLCNKTRLRCRKVQFFLNVCVGGVLVITEKRTTHQQLPECFATFSCSSDRLDCGLWGGSVWKIRKYFYTKRKNLFGGDLHKSHSMEGFKKNSQKQILCFQFYSSRVFLYQWNSLWRLGFMKTREHPKPVWTVGTVGMKMNSCFCSGSTKSLRHNSCR